MIDLGEELLRISPKDSHVLEYSKNGGRTWNQRHRNSSSQGEFLELMESGNEVLATCEKGLFYSKNEGRTWNLRHR